MSEKGDSSNRFLSPHPAHIKCNQKEGGAVHKTNTQLTLTVKESTSWLWGREGMAAGEELINTGKISEPINEMKEVTCTTGEHR